MFPIVIKTSQLSSSADLGVFCMDVVMVNSVSGTVLGVRQGIDGGNK